MEAIRRLRHAVLSREPFDPHTLERRDAALVAQLLPGFELLNRYYLRLEVSGSEHIQRLPTLYVGNHSGGVMGPDLSCTLATLWRQLGADYPLYMMAHDFAMRTIVPVGRAIQALGAMRAHPESAALAFAKGASVLVYPGGELDAFRSFRDRNRVVFGPRVGFVRVAQAAGVPIVPVVAHGAHRSALILDDGARIVDWLGLTERLRLQRFPIALALPWGLGLGPLPYLPLPFSIRLRFLPPMPADPARPAEAIRDAIVEQMQAALDQLSNERGAA